MSGAGIAGSAARDICDYVVVGSGAGGGTIAARLAEAGFHVVVLEAGGDPRELSGGDPLYPAANRLPDDCDIPAFHPFASENDAIAWHFFVRHYSELDRAKRDPNYRGEWEGRKVDGVLYPRASCLGGCTAHNALILIAPPSADWDDLAQQTGDSSWSAANMERYFARLENCRHRWLRRQLAKLGIRGTGHGWKGWLATEKALPREALDDGELVRTIAAAAFTELDQPRNWRRSLRVLLRSFGDPNDNSVVQQASEGLFYTPLATRWHRRNGTRERLRSVATRLPHLLDIRLNCLAAKILLAPNNRAEGVEYLPGARQYGAHRRPSGPSGEARRIYARREVILAGGAFNTPQLLMLSGIGGKDTLSAVNIETRVDLPGVGRNLQDRYEVGVVHRMKRVWPSLRNAEFRRGDPVWRRWSRFRLGMYTSNGAALALIKRSRHAAANLPDLFIMSLLAPFHGYFPGYSTAVAKNRDRLTWCVLKAHTRNRAGIVSLKSAHPATPPHIDFRYFHTDDDPQGLDLKAAVEGVRLARRLARPLVECGAAVEEIPGPEFDGDAELERFVRDHAWGHHACGSCAIGKREAGGVLRSDFGVHGTTGLRVVDASVFPRIPGYFIASAVYMIAEKAADVVLADAMVIRPPGLPEMEPAGDHPVLRQPVEPRSASAAAMAQTH